MKNPLLVPEFRELLASNNIDEIKEFCTTTPPSVVADFLGALSAKENRNILLGLTPDIRSQIFSYYDDDVKLSLMSLFENGELVSLIARMLDEERMGFLKLLPIGKQREIRDLARKYPDKESRELAEVAEQVLKAELPSEEEMTAEEIAGEIQPLIQVYKLVSGKTTKIDYIEKECWINIVNPSKDDLPLLAQHFAIPVDFLTASLDIDETARVEVEDNATLIIIKVPYFDVDNPDTPYYTLPIGVILTGGLLITASPKDGTVLRDFIEGNVKNITTVTGAKFILQIMLRALMLFLQFLKQINNAANMIQKKLEQESKNRQLIKLMNFEKSLVYFTTSLRTNELMLERIQKHSIIQANEEVESLIEDIIIENRQALEMANVYSDILSGMMDAFASVISNNLNITIKFLTSMTIIVTIPGTVAAFYGMNVNLPFQTHPHGFLFVVLTSLVLAVTAVFVFVKKKWL
jgi:magnesium transporter